MADGSLIFDTKVDTNGIDGALKKIAGIAAASGAVADIAKTGTEFEASMSRVQAVSGATKQQLESLTSLAREYGANTVFSSSECADALNYMSMAGWSAEQMTSGLPGVLNLAAAAGEDLGTTSDIVTDALTAFGMKAEDSAHFADILATASSKSNTNVSMMGETFKYVAPVAGALGYSAEDVAVAVGLMANNGIKASQAGTSLRTMLSNLTEPTDKQAAAMNELGISLTDSEGNMKSLDTLLGDMRRSFSGLDEAQKASYASVIAGQEGMSGLLAIVNAADTDFNNLKSAIYDCDGACDAMAETMTDNVSGEMKTLESMVEELELSLYDMFKPMLKDAIPKVQDAVEWITEHLDEIAAIAKPVGAALAAVFAANKIVSFGKTTVSTIKTIKSAFMSLSASNPLGWVLAAVGAIAGLSTAMNEMSERRIAEMEEMREKARNLTEEQERQKEALEETAEAWDSMHQSSKSSAQAADDRVKALSASLLELVNADGTIKDGTEEKVTSIIDEINSLTGSCLGVSDGLITKNDEVLGSYDAISKSLDDIIQKNATLSYIDAYKDQYESAIKNRKDNASAVQDAMYAIEAERGKREAAQREFSEGYRLHQSGADSHAEWDYYTRLTEMQNAISDSLEREKKLRENLTLAQTTQAEQNSMIDQYSNLLALAETGNYEEANKVIEQLNNGFIDSSHAPIEVLKKQKDDAALYYSELKALAAKDGTAVSEDMLAEAKRFADLAEQEYKLAGQRTGDGFIEGLNGKKVEISQLVGNIASLVSSVFNTALGIHSPSRVMAESGQYAAEGVAVGLEAGSKNVINASDDLASSLLSGFNTSSIYNSLAAPSSFPSSYENQVGSSSAQPASTPQNSNTPPTVTVYIGDDQIRNFVVEAVTDANANSGGWSV